MPARSETDALRALGARLRASGAVAAPCPAASPYPAGDVAAGLARLRAVVSGETPAPSGPADSGDLTADQLRAYAARYKPENARRAVGRSSGWRELPQCAGCRAIIKYPGAQCSACGFMDGGGYLGVPAKTSHLERWR